MKPTFYRAAAVASILSAITTLGLIFLPQFLAPAEGLIGRMQRVADPVYQLRAWIYLVHPLLVFTAALGVAVACRGVAPGRALAGILAFGLWAITEAGQQTLTLFAFDDWRRAWLAGDAAVRATMELRVAIYDGLWDAAYALLLIGFLIGNILYSSMMMARPERLARIVGAFIAAAALLTAFILSGEIGGPTLPDAIGFWAYPAIQPLGRLLTGVWLLGVASSGEPRLKARA